MQLFVINPDNLTEEDVRGYARRIAARGVVLDGDGRVGVLYSTTDKYIKLAGGGVDEGETHEEAFRREIREELGCEITHVNELCVDEERRKEKELLQFSYCFSARVVGEKGVPSLTETELARGMEVRWLTPEEAYSDLSTAMKDHKEHLRFMRTRDAYILKQFQEGNKT